MQAVRLHIQQPRGQSIHLQGHLQKELAPSGIQVNAVACGAIDTDMNGHLSDDDKASLAEEIPAGRFGDPQEVAELVKSLSGMNSYLTGQIITLDGGWI